MTGLGGNLVIIDDPLKPGDAYSEAMRTRVLDWYRNTLLTRPNDKKAARFILDVIRERLPFPALKHKIMVVDDRYGDATLLIEESPISKGLIQSLREQRLYVTECRPETDKRARLIAQSDLFSSGSVFLPKKAPWLEGFEAELLAFPGRYDDQVDALTQGLAWGRDSWSRRARFRRIIGGY